jgi:hypothetical protein
MIWTGWAVEDRAWRQYPWFWHKSYNFEKSNA